MWVSPQGFDWRGKNREGWLQAFLDVLQNDEPSWLDGVVFGPQVAISLSELREAVPAGYPIRRYPDITHSGGGQYEVDDWDDAFGSTLARVGSVEMIKGEKLPFKIWYFQDGDPSYLRVSWK